jgi:hypothetical protein
VNAEKYLLITAQQRVANANDLPAPLPILDTKGKFFTKVFAPVYRVLPWSLRSKVLQLMPGSHRQQWSPRERKPNGPAV